MVFAKYQIGCQFLFFSDKPVKLRDNLTGLEKPMNRSLTVKGHRLWIKIPMQIRGRQDLFW